MENLSGLKPLGVAVLVKPYEPERKGGLIQIPAHVASRVSMVDNRAIVVDVGPDAWRDESVARAVPGDHVLITKFAGFMVSGDDTLDGEAYRLVNDRDIFCRISVKGAQND